MMADVIKNYFFSLPISLMIISTMAAKAIRLMSKKTIDNMSKLNIDIPFQKFKIICPTTE